MRLFPLVLLACLLPAVPGCGPWRGAESLEMRQQRYEANMAQGRAFLADSRYDEASHAFAEAVRCRPDSAPAQTLLGFSYLKLKRTEPAEQAFLKAVSLDPENVSAWCNLGAVAVRNHQYSLARQRLQRAVTLDPGFALGQYSLGNLLMHMGEFGPGRQALETAFALDPSLADLPNAQSVGFPDEMQSLETCLSYARVLAAAGNAEGTARYLDKARDLGFKDWAALLAEKDFDKIRDDPKLQAFRADRPPHAL